MVRLVLGFLVQGYDKGSDGFVQSFVGPPPLETLERACSGPKKDISISIL